MKTKVKVAIIGPGNIGTDLMYKVMRSENLEMSAMLGIVESEGLKRAGDLGFVTSTEGINFLEKNPELADIVFDATTAKAHSDIHAPSLEKLGKISIDLTPAAVGKMVSPMVNMKDALSVRNVNLITCGGQATTPIIYAISKSVDIEYAEIITSVASKSAGPGTRKNIDEYTRTTARAVEALANAERCKVMTIFNPAVPEVPMRNTIYIIPKNQVDIDKVEADVVEMVKEIQKFVPGYELTLAPKLEKGLIVTTVTVNGAGDFLPPYAGNLDIETASAVKIAELYAENILKGEI